ncbi:MAG: ATP-binding protein, partial [Saprospiraceae bacterium]|nr:ATP-binding protein [Saprospiraceae bacterium]
RDLSQQIRAHLQQKEITLVIGPRQAGKTTLLRELSDDLKHEGHPCLFFNLDIDTDAPFFKSQQALVDRVQATFGDRGGYVFIDEVQRIENAGLFLKGLYDRQLPWKWIATGSGSLELKEKIAESLVGRKRNFYLLTVSVWEYIAYKTEGIYGDQPARILAIDPVLEEQLLLDFLRFGGYPRVVTAKTNPEKRAILAEIFQGYIERDIQVLLRLEKSRSFVTLLQLLANRTGQLINYNELASACNLSVASLKNYLWYAEKTFIIQGISPYFKNKNKEIIKAPQYYFLDNGLTNFMSGHIDSTGRPEWIGQQFQQLVFQMLHLRFQHEPVGIHYWRTQSQAEVDFVLDFGTYQLPVEVKSAQMTTPKITRSLHSFIEQYQPAEAWVINRSLQETVVVGNTQVRFLPWYMLGGANKPNPINA